MAKKLEELTVFPFPLYHGTNRTALSMPWEERERIKSACAVLAPYYRRASLAAGLQDVIMQQEEGVDTPLKGICADVSNADTILDRMEDKSTGFEYVDLYVTTYIGQAVYYARKSAICGELSYAVYWVRRGLERLGRPLPEMTAEEKAALDVLLPCEKEFPCQPVVILLNQVERKDILGKELGDAVYDPENPKKWEYFLTAAIMDEPQYKLRLPWNYPLKQGVALTVEGDGRALIDQETQETEALRKVLQAEYGIEGW